MMQRNGVERFCIWWWDTPGEDFVGELARTVGWPFPVETDNHESWDGGGAD